MHQHAIMPFSEIVTSMLCVVYGRESCSVRIPGWYYENYFVCAYNVLLLIESNARGQLSGQAFHSCHLICRQPFSECCSNFGIG